MELRAFHWDDLPAIIDLINTANAADDDPQRAVQAEYEEFWRSGAPSPETSCVVATVDGRLVGYSNTRRMGDLEPERGMGGGRVLPDFRGQGIGRALIDASDARYLNWAAQQAAPDKPITLQRFVHTTLPGDQALLAAAGYVYARSFYRMHIDLDEPPAPPAYPPGVELRPFDRDRHGRTVYEAEEEAFQDHVDFWGHYSYDDFHSQYIATSTHDPALWLIAWDGDAVAGGALCEPIAGLARPTGIVMLLFVRRQWRKRGLASALLQDAFARFWQRGLTAADLYVDSESQTNAVVLYERAGMRVQRESQLVIRTLRPAADKVTQSAGD